MHSHSSLAVLIFIVHPPSGIFTTWGDTILKNNDTKRDMWNSVQVAIIDSVPAPSMTAVVCVVVITLSADKFPNSSSSLAKWPTVSHLRRVIKMHYTKNHAFYKKYMRKILA